MGTLLHIRNAGEHEQRTNLWRQVNTTNYFPSEDFELTADSQGAHIETHGKLILRTLSYLTVNSQDELTL